MAQLKQDIFKPQPGKVPLRPEVGTKTELSGKAGVGTWLKWIGGYCVYLLYHIVVSPASFVRLLRRVRRYGFHNSLHIRLFGGAKPPCKDEWVLVVASGQGETRTGIQAAEEIGRECKVPIAVLTQLAVLPKAMAVEGSDFPIGFAPFNSPFSSLITLLRWRPKQLLFVEFSGNYHMAFLAKLLGIPTALINVNLPEGRMRKLMRKPLGRWQFSFVDAFSVQAPAHLIRLAALGVDPGRITVSGVSMSTMQFPAAGADLTASKWRKILQIPDDAPVILLGSTYPEEESILADAYLTVKREFPKAVMILAPRFLDRKDHPKDWSLTERGIDFELRSMLDRHERAADVILIDSMGELREMYSLATVAHIGGTLVPGVGGHTPLEALAWGVPFTLGPNFSQQEAAVEIVTHCGFGVVCRNAQQVSQAWTQALKTPSLRNELKARAEDVALEFGHVHAQSYESIQQTNSALLERR